MYCHIDLLTETAVLVRVTTDDNSRELGRFEMETHRQNSRVVRARAEQIARERFSEEAD